MTVNSEIKQIIIDNVKVAAFIAGILLACSVVGHLENENEALIKTAKNCSNSAYLFDNPEICKGSFNE